MQAERRNVLVPHIQQVTDDVARIGQRTPSEVQLALQGLVEELRTNSHVQDWKYESAKLTGSGVP